MSNKRMAIALGISIAGLAFGGCDRGTEQAGHEEAEGSEARAVQGSNSAALTVDEWEAWWQIDPTRVTTTVTCDGKSLQVESNTHAQTHTTLRPDGKLSVDADGCDI